MNKSLTYADAGVNIDKANDLVDTIKNIAGKTSTPGVIGQIGGFGGLFSLDLNKFKQPVLVSSTDGVGTKLKIAFMLDKHDTIGIDLVAMCVNDISVQGAKPLFFLDYLSMGKLETKTASSIIKGIAKGCKEAECALIGGETAEMPGLYKQNEYDLAGFTVGLVEKEKIIDGSTINAGDIIIGVASSGLHSNGYSLVNKVCFEILKHDIDSYIKDIGKTIGEELLTPTYIYSKLIQKIIKTTPIKGIAHITGGGITDNICRIIPENCTAAIHKNSWEIPHIFKYIQQAGNIKDSEMMRTFNNGIGLAIVVAKKEVQQTLNQIEMLDKKAFVIGKIVTN